MKRFLPAPLLSVILALAWLLLNRSIAPGQVLLAVVLGLALPLLTAPLRPLAVRVRRPAVIARLVGRVLLDAVRSNLVVLGVVVRPPRRPPRSAFVTVPLEIRDPHALAALAIITTVVPGTVWCEVAADRSALRLHLLDAADEAAFVAYYKARYERPLMEIFE